MYRYVYLGIRQAVHSAKNVSRRNIACLIDRFRKGHGYLQKTMLFTMNQKKSSGTPAWTTHTKKQEKPTNPNANHMKDKNQNHAKRSLYSVECGVSSAECKAWSVKWEVWSGKRGVENVVPSVACQVRSVECKCVKYKVSSVKCRV